MKKENGSIILELTASRTGAKEPDSLQSWTRTGRIDGVVTGLLVGFNDDGNPLIDFPTNISGIALTARSTVVLSREDQGQEVVLLFENGDYRQPIIMGTIKPSVHDPTESYRPPEVKIDGESLVFTADKEIVLRCGKANITLTKAGKVLIRGAYLSSSSSGVNRIKGGSVQIN